MLRTSLACTRLLPLLGVAACDPGASIAVRRPLSPVPASGCIEAALGASPQVLQVRPSKPARSGSHFAIVLRDSAARDGAVGANVMYRPGRRGASDSVPTIEVFVVWIGTLTKYSDQQKRRWAELGMTLLADLRAACAPDAPGDVQCEERGIGRRNSRGCPAA